LVFYSSDIQHEAGIQYYWFKIAMFPKCMALTLRLLIYVYIYIYMEHLFLMFLDHTQRRSTVGRTPLDE